MTGRISMFDLHRLLSEHGWEWKRADNVKHPIIANRRGKLFQILTAAPNPRQSPLNRAVPATATLQGYSAMKSSITFQVTFHFEGEQLKREHFTPVMENAGAALAKAEFGLARNVKADLACTEIALQDPSTGKARKFAPQS